MKKLLCALTSLFLPLSVSALPIGNPSDPANYVENTFSTLFLRYGDSDCNLLSYRFGYYGDFVFNRHLEADSSRSKADYSSAKMATNAASLTVNFCELLDVFVTLGATDFQLVGMGKGFSPSSPAGFTTTLNTSTDFSWSVGARTILYVWGNSVLGVSGQYFSTDPHITNVGVVFGRNSTSHSTTFEYKEAQVSAALSHMFCFGNSPLALIPYIGAKYARVWVNTSSITLPPITIPAVPPGPFLISLPGDIKNSRKFGWALGTTLRLYGNLGVTVEGQWADENAVSVTGQLRY